MINVVPGLGGEATAYRLGATSYPVGTEGVERLTGHLAGLMQVTPALRVNLRADQYTDYRFVEPVLSAVSTAAALWARTMSIYRWWSIRSSQTETEPRTI